MVSQAGLVAACDFEVIAGDAPWLAPGIQTSRVRVRFPSSPVVAAINPIAPPMRQIFMVWEPLRGKI